MVADNMHVGSGVKSDTDIYLVAFMAALRPAA